MARRSLSTQGRILAAGVSIAAGAGLVGFMAAGDHTADASPTRSSVVTPSDRDGASSATPADGRSFGDDGASTFPSGDAGFQPQPQTRTGGS
jgi:hypothetical protein